MGYVLLAMVMFVIMLVVIGALVDCKRFVIRNYIISTDKIKEEYKFAVLSDLHNRKIGNKDKLIRSVLKEEPDSILIAGDMINGVKNGSFEHAVSLLELFSKQKKIYYGNGNHEYRLRVFKEVYGDLYDRYAEKLKNIHIEPLINETVVLEEKNISIVGTEIDRMYYKKWKKPKMEVAYLNEIIGKPNRDTFSIMIAHNPEYFEQYAEWGADLVLSGHIHGGIMRLPFLGGVISPSFRLFPKYDGGIFKKENSTMILSRGMGMHTIPIRIFNPGEIVLITLTPAIKEMD